MAVKFSSFYKALETFWSSNNSDAEKQYQLFQNFKKSTAKTPIGKSEKTLLEITAVLLLRQANRVQEANNLEAKHKRAFNRITQPLFKHRWKRLQLIEAFKTGNQTASIEDVQILIDEAQKNNWIEELLRALFLKHMVEKLTGQFTLALETAQQVKLLATEHEHQFYLQQSAWAVPHIYYYFGEKKLAFEECLRIKHLFTTDFSQQQNKGFYVLLADCYAFFKHYREARSIYEQLQAFLEQTTEPDNVTYITILINTSHVLQQQKNIAKAESQLKTAAKIAAQINLPMYQLTALIGLADIYLQTKQYQAMQKALDAASPLATKANVAMYKIKLLELKSAHAKATGKYKEALALAEKHHHEFKVWKQLETDEKLKTLETKQQLELQQLKEQSMKKELELLAQNLQASHAHIEQKDKLIKQFAAYFNELEQTNIRRREIFVKLREMVRTTEQAQQTERTNYSSKFNDTHQAAMYKLIEQFPTITNAEAGTAVMLTKGLSNKDISSLTLTSVRNIEKHRLNLRKKMKLKRSDDLIQSILKAL
ncbi:MAG: hypothetical protein U0T72_06065 [Chitinophagales bacterium]